MAVFVDIYGNEARELIAAAQFGIKNDRATAPDKRKQKRN